MIRIHHSVKFLHEDGLSFVVDSAGRIWTVRELYDEEGDEVDSIEDAATALVTCAKYMLCGTADLTLMPPPEIN